jgi:hypothetical protein
VRHPCNAGESCIGGCVALGNLELVSVDTGSCVALDVQTQAGTNGHSLAPSGNAVPTGALVVGGVTTSGLVTNAAGTAQLIKCPAVVN